MISFPSITSSTGNLTNFSFSQINNSNSNAISNASSNNNVTTSSSVAGLNSNYAPSHIGLQVKSNPLSSNSNPLSFISQNDPSSSSGSASFQTQFNSANDSLYKINLTQHQNTSHLEHNSGFASNTDFLSGHQYSKAAENDALNKYYNHQAGAAASNYLASYNQAYGSSPSYTQLSGSGSFGFGPSTENSGYGAFRSSGSSLIMPATNFFVNNPHYQYQKRLDFSSHETGHLNFVPNYSQFNSIYDHSANGIPKDTNNQFNNTQPLTISNYEEFRSQSDHNVSSLSYDQANNSKKKTLPIHMIIQVEGLMITQLMRI